MLNEEKIADRIAALVEKRLKNSARAILAPEYVDTEGAARITGFSTKALEGFRFRKQGGPRYVKIGKSVRYAISDLRVWMEGGDGV